MNNVNESGVEGVTGANGATSDQSAEAKAPSQSVDSDRDDPTNNIDCWRLPPFRCNYLDMRYKIDNWWTHTHTWIHANNPNKFYYYYIVAKPYDSGYKKFSKTYQKNCLDYVRRMLNPQFYFMVKETNATKTHVHMIIIDEDCTKYEGLDKRKTARYKYHVDEINTKPKSIDRLFEYLIKESKHRMLNIYSDYGLKTGDI